jgi:dihydroorotase
MTESFRIRRPDDWHVHLRDDAMLAAVLPATAQFFGRAIVMPNLKPPVVTTAAALGYRNRIKALLPVSAHFTPLMTCYLTDTVDAADLSAGFRAGAKLYPAGATTNSDLGVTHLARIRTALETMQTIGMPLLIHGEVVDSEVDVFDREAVFIERVLGPLVHDFPALKVVLEHVTTAEGVDFVRAAPDTVAATITPHHLILNRNAMFERGIRPHAYCLPVVKRERHRLALRAAATSGHSRFFLGTDSAPHLRTAKEHDCGCAGVFNSPTALECYAQVFDEENQLANFERFASLNGPRFYGLPVNSDFIEFYRVEPQSAHPDQMTPQGPVCVFMPPSPLRWAVRETA